MNRIANRALVLLLASLVLVSLIAARPLPAGDEQTPARLSVPIQPAAPDPAPHTAPPAPAPQPSVAARALSTTDADELRALRPQQARAALAATRAALPRMLAGKGPRMRGTFVVQTERLDLYVGKGSFPTAQVAELAPALEQALRAAERRLGTRLSYRVSVGFYRLPPRRGVRGMAYTSERRAELYYRPHESQARALTIAAHELAHHLEAQRYGEQNQRLADTILHEGLATWIAADRWLPQCDAASWRQRARQLARAGVPLRLQRAERYGADSAYELWASFVDFLIDRYGWERFDELYASGRGRAVGSANYQRVLGKSLDELADEWREWVGEF